MKPATPQQIKAINAALAVKGMMEEKPAIVRDVTAGRTTHSSQLYFDEAKVLLKSILSCTQDYQEIGKSRMIAKIFAMAHEMGWINNLVTVEAEGKMVQKKDYRNVYAWIRKYGYLHKDLKQYKYEELPKLLSQFEQGPYQHYLQK